MINHYKVTFKDPETGEPVSVVLKREGHPSPGQVAEWVSVNGIQTEDFFVPGSALLKVERDDTPEPPDSIYYQAPVVDPVPDEPEVDAPSADTPTDAPVPDPAATDIPVAEDPSS